MSKETSSVMSMIMDYFRAETDIVVQDVLDIIDSGDETAKAMATVMAIVQEEN